MNHDRFPFSSSRISAINLFLLWADDIRSFKQQAKTRVEPEH